MARFLGVVGAVLALWDTARYKGGKMILNRRQKESPPLTFVRANWLLVMAFAGIFICLWLLIYYKIEANTAAGGVLIMLVGKFVGNFGTAFDFDWGSSRGSKDKDETAKASAMAELERSKQGGAKPPGAG